MNTRVADNAKQELGLPGLCRSITEASPLPMAAVEGPGHIVGCVNPAFCLLIGKPEEDLIGKAFSDVVPPGDECLSLLDRVYRTGQAETHTGQENSASYTLYWSYAMWPVLSADGSPVGIIILVTETTPSHQQAAAMNQALLIGSVRQHELTEAAERLNVQLQAEIGERNRAEEALRESIKRFHFVTESMPQKIFTAKANGEMNYFNRQWMEFTGLSFDQIENWGWTQFIHAQDVKENVRAWQHSVDTGEPFQFVHRFRRHDGAYHWHLSRAHAMRDAAGKNSLWIGSSTDIHEAKETEEELRHANEDLNQFAFAASHDLQEPLRMIILYSQLLVKRHGTQLNVDASLYMNYITEGTQRMAEMLADLLSYTEAGADRESPAEFIDFKAVYDKAMRNLQAAVAESGAVVSVDHLPVVQGREVHFLQLLQNLISNAIKYRSERPLRIHISAEKQDHDWRFAVADNGMGIEPKYQQQIFGVFKRLHGKEIPGTGIGLAICQRVVERYGGRMWVESEPDRGATFYFTLPVDSSGLGATAGDMRDGPKPVPGKFS
jgi:PAS domain S-box-containing protein